MTDDRSERLRKRRKQSANRADRDRTQTNGENSSKPDKPSEQSEPTAANDTSTDEDDDNSESTTSIKENQIGTYMYLPESQTKDLRRLYNVLKAEYEFKYDEEFEKNRHFYPLVIQYGLDSLDGMDAAEIRARLRDIQ